LRVFESVGKLLDKKGQELAVSDWKEITPFSVSSFAEATGDRQWIHLDEERARRESPFGGPVAHGFLTLSLLPELMASAVRFEGVRMGVNYGLNKVRFTAPVPVGAFVRLRATLLDVEADERAIAGKIGGTATLTWAVVFEIQGQDKPACVAESIARLYF
jgi:acyl dehydratase